MPKPIHLLQLIDVRQQLDEGIMHSLALPAVRRMRLALFASATALALGFPAGALASQAFAITSPSGSFPAGGDPSYTTLTTLDSSAGSPGKVAITLAPGVLASLAANPSCLKGSPQHTSACQIGQGSASTVLPLLSLIQLTAYLVPPTSSTDAAGIDLVTSAPGVSPTHVEVALVQTSSGNVASRLSFDLSGLGAVGQALTSMSLTVNGTLDGKPFTRMPSNCSPGHSTLAITYSNGQTETSTASPDFTPTGCSSLPFNPTLGATAIKDPGDSGVKVITTQSQTANEAAGLSTALQLPWPTLASNTAALSIQNTSTPVGTAVATSPLQPAPLAGIAYLTGGAFTPTLTLRFPPPVALTLVGSVNLGTHTVTFSNLPDVPQTSLVVTLYGGPQAAEATACKPPSGLAHATFVGQNGKTVTASQPLTVSGCPAVPSISGAKLTGLTRGRPSLDFKLTRGSNESGLRSITIGLPRGLRFNAKRLAHYVSVSKPHALYLRGGRLVVTLRRSASRVTVRIRVPGLIEGMALRHRTGTRVAIAVTDASGGHSSFVVFG